MRKTIILIAIAFASPLSMLAQTDDEIIVTDEEGLQEAIELPEALGTDVDSLLSLYHTQHNLQTDNDCDFPDFNPQYSQEEIIQRLYRLPTVMEMAYNNVVQGVIDRYTNRLRHTVSVMLGAQNFYMPIFEQALETYGLPLELKYLPVIESSLNPNAVSRVGATGLWQFMIGTAKQYGLEVNSLVDERRDPVKASYAAARYLNDLYQIFGDWNLVIAAYNCGPENVNKAIHRSGGETDYWKIYPYLPRETRGYVPSFIAANYVMNYYCEHNICPMTTTLPAKTDTIVVNRDVHFEQIAAVLGIDKQQIEELNPQYRRDMVNGSTAPSTIRLPESLVAMFIDRQDSIYAYDAERLVNRRSVVEVDESSAPRQSSRRSRKKSRSSRGKHSVTVRQGDTLSEIAKRNGTTVAKLRRLNGIKGSSIRAGKKIRVK